MAAPLAVTTMPNTHNEKIDRATNRAISSSRFMLAKYLKAAPSCRPTLPYFMVPLLSPGGVSAPPPATLSLLQLDADAARTLQDQLLDRLRKAILERRVRPGQRLPSTRLLARQLSVSRNTVLAVFDQLISEGYLRGSRGSGTYVSDELPDQLLRPSKDAKLLLPQSQEGPLPPAVISPTAFRPCIPLVAEFPLERWESLRRRVLHRRGARLLHYSAPAGQERLREQISLYLRDYRGVRCEANQILVTAGAQQAFRIAARALSSLGKGVWFEDP